MSNGVPLVEFYRPTNFEEIVLDPLNKQILKNIIEKSYFPNLLFYGPPGTGKTTTIINLINAYQEKLNIKNKDLIIHLNASDERGIDIIRNQINYFVNSKPLFYSGMKFVILDEVDYMTKNAQQALRYLLQNFTSGVRFCLICNYISKIDEGLQNEFTKLRFNQLPKDEIINFLKHISKSENLNLSDKSISCIQQLYNSDIRSMINFMQSNQDIGKEKIEISVIDKDIWELLIKKIIKKEKLDRIAQFIYEISIQYNIDKKNIIKNFINYLIRNYPKYINNNFLYFIENLTHTQNPNNTLFVYYAVTKLQMFIKQN
jgi:replication factor C subunit 3/5